MCILHREMKEAVASFSKSGTEWDLLFASTKLWKDVWHSCKNQAQAASLTKTRKITQKRETLQKTVNLGEESLEVPKIRLVPRLVIGVILAGVMDLKSNDG